MTAYFGPAETIKSIILNMQYHGADFSQPAFFECINDDSGECVAVTFELTVEKQQYTQKKARHIYYYAEQDR